ncbi:MAG TPA: hypothetical protein VJ011_00105 [Steroidobacteraceae bacterium]|nr:hypothetical protein [Steroidobacteraceae bacterium]
MRAVRRAHFKYVRNADREFLFDLANDPLERANLKLQHPALFADLKAAYVAWEREMLPIPDALRVPPAVYQALEALDPLPGGRE